MQTDGQFWKFHGLKRMGHSRQTDQTVLSWGIVSVQEAGLAGSPAWQAILRQQWSKALRGAEPG